ncbi:uncharacterized protein si:ch211-113e8.11 isoform X2 [Phyllopteryx taeniolatus]|uniref:uncharacterized protein si:ch211-113e8.11 isoform X2 n=1 Tax=Phyllopteryx taeniolatus TaxID=161469 RepID=UPI002AD56079|nr:uncharacterized protein si:ch211-113e8.11 isoform X2 [Phyllopteryx taeniolatus]
MNALVGYSGSSDSDSDEDSPEKAQRGRGGADVADWAPPDRKTPNFMLESGSTTSESDGSDRGDREPGSSVRGSGSQPGPPSASSATSPRKLPPPSLHGRSESSVFANPFKAQAEQKLSALQQHVPLTMQARPSHIGGKRMCLSYRKSGRCRFGIKCKFAHDSDLQTAVAPNDSRATSSDEAQVGPREPPRDEPEGRRVKKRRVGVSDALIPPKKAMKQYTMLRSKGHHNMY